MRTASLLSVVAACLFTGANLSAVEIIAHRGASHDAPENTLASLRLGWEQNADVNELDIYLSKDGQIVVLHDATTKRTAGLDKKVGDQTLEELRTLDAGSWKGAKWAGEKIPTLAESLELLPEGKRIFIEIKDGAQILPELKRVIDASQKKPEQLNVIAFNYDTISQAKQLLPSLKMYWLVSAGKDKKTGNVPTLEEMISKAKAAGLEGLNLNYKFPIDSAFVSQVHAAGMKLYVWTVNDAAVGQALATAGVDGIATDRPAWLREQIAAKAK